jgi:hypothetical protein
MALAVQRALLLTSTEEGAQVTVTVVNRGESVGGEPGHPASNTSVDTAKSLRWRFMNREPLSMPCRR